MAQSAATETKLKLISRHGICDVVFNEKTLQHALMASRDIMKDEVIAEFSAREILTEPNFLTIQIDHKKHILLQPDFLQYTNHSCEPNVFFDITKKHQVALREIKAGEELTFFYPSTEWEMAQPFHCHCGSKKCLNIIRGAANVHPAILNEYRIGDFILSQKK
jgi:hypothetical protein